jgi:signal transduction histidine kinase
VDPAATPRRRTPPMLIEKLVVDGVSIGLGDGIEIAPGHRHLELDFTLCDLVAPQRASFLYKLEGFDETWKSTSQRSVSYTNLKPGPYRFHVRAKVSSSQGDFSEASLPFSLRPHFYQTDWFSGLAALVCGTLILAGLKLYARQTKARYALLLNERMAERSRLAREMHDTVIQGCVGVSTLLEAVDRFRPGNPVEAGRLLNDARVQVAATLEEARQAIWDLRYATVENASITILFDLARKLGAEHHIEIETELAGRGELNAETDRTLLLVGREALRNAVAHARPSKIRISVTFRPSEAVLEVSDDGVGFDVSNEMQARGRHFGMIGMRERIEKAGGSIAIESSPGNGVRITARAPLPKTGDEPSGGVPDPLFRTR